MEHVENGSAWHQTQMQLMAQWAAYFGASLALIGLGAAVAIRLVGTALKMVGDYHTNAAAVVFVISCIAAVIASMMSKRTS